MEVAVSYLKNKEGNVKTVEALNYTSANYLHVDLMDGGFVLNKNFKIEETLELLKLSHLPLDIHLMVFDPIIYIADLSKVKPECITFHLEACKDIMKCIEEIKKQGIKVGIALKLETDINELWPYLVMIDKVLVMGVNPGMGGQKMREETPNRVKELKRIREENNLHFLIEVDGGVNEETKDLVRDADILASGSYVCMSEDMESKIRILKFK